MRVNIKPAASGRYNHNYDFMTIASMDLGQLVPISVFEAVATDDINRYHGKSMLRLAPQVFPAYGKLFLKTASFFVPEYQIFEYSEALRNNMNMYKGKNIDFVHTYHYHINHLFSSHVGNTPSHWCTLVATASAISQVPLSNTYDFMDIEANGAGSTMKFYKLTSLGRIYYKYLKGCGIDFASFTFSGNYATDLSSADSVLSVTCLLSYAKVWCDMFLNSHRYNDDSLVALLHHIHDNDSYVVSGTTYFDSSTFQISEEAIGLILTSIAVPHQQNMYTMAWNSPNSPVGVNPSSTMDGINPNGPVSPYQGSPGALTANTLTSFDQDNHLTSPGPGSNNLFNISSFGLRILQSFTDFVRRNNLFGNKAVQRTLARLGIKSDDYKSHYVIKLSETSQRIDFSAIMSNSDTDLSGGSSGKTLGSYAGFGICSLDIDFNYKCQENGFIIVLAWLQEAPIWIRGTQPFNLRRYSFDYWTPEYDGQTVRAIPLMEFSSSKVPVLSSETDKSVYGFVDLYDEYRFSRDQVLGDFVLDEETTRNFFFGRDLSHLRYRRSLNGIKPQSHTVQYFGKIGDDDTLTNPFQWSASLADRFYLSVDWEVSAVRPIKSKSDALMLNGEGSDELPLGGSVIN